MEQFEYLPQLIVAKDGLDEFANLIHISKSKCDETYYCPCCNGIVNRRALSSEKVQSHYYHLTEKCTKQEQIKWFCKNWLFTQGSKFYVENILYEVLNIEIEPSIMTKFGEYKPSVLVNTKSGETIYFELFFLNRKRENDYYCKWQELGNDVINVNLKEFIYKDDENIIPHFTYLYHDNVCYLKEYIVNDLYADTIGKIKRTKGKYNSKDVLKEKINIELLDDFWKSVQEKKSKDDILDIIRKMNYEEVIICYEVIRRKECMKYLKDDVLNIIHENSVNILREKLKLSNNDNVKFDIRHLSGKTYRAGIYVDYSSSSIKYNDILYSPFCDIVLRKNVHSLDIILDCSFFDPKNTETYFSNYYISELLSAYNKSVASLKNFDNMQMYIDNLPDKYKVFIYNNYATVLAKVHGDNYEEVIEGERIYDFNIENIIKLADEEIKSIKKIDELNEILKSETMDKIIKEVESYTNLFNVKLNNNISNNKIIFYLYIDKYCKRLEYNVKNIKNEVFKILDEYIKKYCVASNLLDKINSCKNRLWSTKAYIDAYGNIRIDLTLKFSKKYTINSYITINHDDYKNIKNKLVLEMNDMIKYLEYKGMRIMEV